MIVHFYDYMDDHLLNFAVIIAKHGDKWVLCKHKERNSYQFPCVRREAGETIQAAVTRKLLEETGAIRFDLSSLCAYSVTGKNIVNTAEIETFGMLYAADIQTFALNSSSETEQIKLFDTLPEAPPYPRIQSALFQEYLRRINTCNRIDLYMFWQSILIQDAPALEKYFHPNALINWHCTNERFTAEEFIRVNCTYPGQWEGQVVRLEQIGDLSITVTHVYPTDCSASFHVTSFFRIKDGKILTLDEYWADDGPPPAWRRKMSLGAPIET